MSKSACLMKLGLFMFGLKQNPFTDFTLDPLEAHHEFEKGGHYSN